MEGTNSEEPGVRAFLAIPYAAPPVGENRWRLPQPGEPWSGVRQATAPGASCPQPTTGVVAQFLITPASKEDCLTLSVWSREDAEGLPVMVWFHGGGFSTGSAHQPYYIGDRLASKGAVVVGVNYRLGALGFLAADMLADDDARAGNYGLADQVAALEWVRDNAEAFGGDPDNVTIFGESAGGFSVCGHLASPMSQGLFEKAIIESGGGCQTLQPADAAAQAGCAHLAAQVGCDDAECLRSVPARALVNASFNPSLVADGERLVTSAYEQAVEGTLADIPILTGSNADEATLFTLGAPEPSDADLLAAFGETYENPEAVAALYPDSEFPTNLAKQQAYSTESAFTCPALRFASVVPTGYSYYYSYVSPGNPFGLGATHGAELAFVFGHPEGIRNLPTEIDEGSQRLASRIQEMWAHFAESGSPGSSYETYGESGSIIELTRPIGVTQQIRNGRCDALAGLAG